MHFDLIVARGPDLGLHRFAGSKQERAAARDQLRPTFEALLVLLGPTRALL